ncbi:MAG TPA: hypothetical protein VF401_00515 [Candidatus Saccharimonadales bacterium]
MSYVKRLPDSASGDLRRFASRESIDIEADLLCAPHWQPCLVTYNGSPIRSIQRGGSNYLESRIEYLDQGSIAAARIVRRILTGKHSELAYLPRSAEPKSITINRGIGTLLLTNSRTGSITEEAVRRKSQDFVDVPPGYFFVFEAPKRAGNLTISELVTQPSYIDDLTTICPQGSTEVFTQDGQIEIPKNLAERYLNA